MSGHDGDDGTSLLSLPNEVFLYDLLPLLSPKDLASLSQVNKQLHDLVEDPGLWRLKTASDFSYRPSIALSKPSDDDKNWFKRVYLGLSKPRVYLWGATENCRLGAVPGVETYTWSSVSSPADATPSFKSRAKTGPTDSLASEGPSSAPDGAEGEETRERIVDLQAGGWCYTARDAKGGVWVWGTLYAERGGWGNDWDQPSAALSDATRIPLPCRAVSVACGRSHLLVLDSDNLIWELHEWGRAYRHTAPELTAPSASGARRPGRAAHIAQIAAGWHVSSCLTADGKIFVWFPFTPEFKNTRTPKEELHGPLTDGGDGTAQGREFFWGEVNADPIMEAPPVPERPEGAPTPARGAFDDAAQRVVRIACGIDFLLALKENGEVWFLPSASNTIKDWVYLPQFSSPDISHITAQFLSIASYSVPSSGAPEESNVLVGKVEGERYDVRGLEEIAAKPLPVLDGAVVQFVAGDWHNAALTNKGDMYTWGEDGHGQLGLNPGDRGGQLYRVYRGQRQTEPKKVTFPADDNGQKAFVFSICAAGMHSGALVLGNKRQDPEPLKVVDDEFDGGPFYRRSMGDHMPPLRGFGRWPLGRLGTLRRDQPDM